MKKITRENISEVAEEIKNILLTTTDTNIVVNKLAEYGINFNPMMDKQKIIDLTFATFDTDKFHGMILDYAGIGAPLSAEAPPADVQDPKESGLDREEGTEVLSQDALNDLFAGLDDNEEEEEENKNDQESNVLSQEDLNDLLARLDDDD